MSQKTMRASELKFQAVAEVKELVYQGYKVKEACEKRGVSPTNYRRWRAKLDNNPEWLKHEEIYEDSRCPKRFARQVSASTRQKVIDEAHKPHHKSANSITKALKATGLVISTTKVIEILEEEGIYGMIQVANRQGDLKPKRGLLRLCEKRQQGL